MGKSSLKVQTMQRLQAEGVACAAIDLTRIGTSDMQPEQWYSSVIDSIVSSLDLYETFDLYSWWEEHRLLSYVRRFDKFIGEVLLTAIPQPIVVFIDEIDSVLSLPFNLDDFFALIRECYNRRSEKPDYDRLTFALLGVTTPSDLMQDKQRTPFNVGRPIELMGFQLHEADPLVQGLAVKSSDPTALMQAVLTWTGGQPFLTQKVCKLILSANDSASIGQEAAWVSALVKSRVIENWEAQDTPEHLKTIRDRLLLSGEQRTGRLLGLYQQIIQQGEVGADDSAEQVDLRLTGVVVKREGTLQVYNQVYQQVFNRDWLERSLATLRPYGSAIAAWLDSGMQDESRLLRGQAYRDALAWSQGKRLDDADYRFLGMSQELETQQVKLKLAAEEQAKQVLSEANRKANQRIRLGAVALGVMLTGAIAAGFSAWQSTQTVIAANSERDQAVAAVKTARQDNQQISQENQTLLDQSKKSEQNVRVASRNLAQSQQQAQQARQRAQQAQQKLQQNVAKTKTELTEIQREYRSAQAASDKAEQNVQVANRELSTARAERQQILTKVNLASLMIAAADVRLKSASSKEEFLSGEPFKALLTGLRAAQQLRQLDRSVWAKDYTQMQTVAALQQAVYRVKEQNSMPHTAYVYSVSFSPDGQTIASGSLDNTIKLWKRDGTLITTLNGHNESVLSVSFSPDGQTIASGSADKTIKLWKRDGTLITTLSGHNAFVSSVSFSPDGQTIASGSLDKTIKLWKRDGTLITTLNGHNDSVYNVSFSPDGQTIASGSADKTIKLWKRDGTLITTLNGHNNSVWSVSFSPDGQTIASGSGDSTIKLWKRDGTPTTTLSGHNAAVRSVSFSPDGQTIASGSFDKTIKLWKRDGTLITTLSGHNAVLFSVSFSPDEQTIASGSGDSTIKLWKRDGTPTTTLSGHNAVVRSVSFSPDEQTIASGSDDKTIKLWKRDGTLITTLNGHNAVVRSVSFSRDGQTIASGSDDKTIKLWKRDGTLITTLNGHNAVVGSVSFSPDGQTIASGSNDKTIKLWKRDGTLITTLNGHSDSVYSVSFSPDGQTIASGSNDKTIKLWKRDGTLITTLSGHNAFVSSVSFSPDGQTIASGSGDSTIKLWKRDGALITTLNGHNDSVYSVSFSPDGQTIASGSFDTIKLWKRDGALITTLNGHNDPVLSINFSPDGQTIASGSVDNTIKLWNLNLDSLATLGCYWLRDYLPIHAEAQPGLEICQNQSFLNANAATLVPPARELAKAKDVEGAIQMLQEAVKRDPNLKLNPQTEAITFAAPAFVDRGKELAKAGAIEAALSSYAKAQELLPDLKISAKSWDTLCWFGSLNGSAKQVLFACENAVSLAPGNDAEYRNSRGLARALTGNSAGAIADFQAYLKSEISDEQKAQRQRWIDALRSGQNPFTPKELESLKNQ